MKLGSAVWLGVWAAMSIGSASAIASEVTLISVTSDAVEGVLQMKLVLDDAGKVTQIKYVAPQSTQTFPIAGLANGLTIMKNGNYEVIKLYSKNFDPASGGPITMDYLFNGITGARANFPLLLDRQGQDWVVYADLNSGKRQFTQMYLKANRVFGQIVGVEKISVR